MVTTNLFTHPVFKDGGFTSNDRVVRRFALRKVLRNLDLAAELGAKTYVFWGGREGAEYDAAKDIRAALDRYREAHRHRSPRYVKDRATTSGSRSSPSRTSRAATSCCRPSGTRWRSSPSSSTRDMVGVNPEVGHEQMAGLNFAHGIAQALWAGQAVPHRPQRPARHQVRPGPGVRPRRPAQRVLPRRPARERRPDGAPAVRRARGTSTTSRSRTEDIDGVWASAAANMRTYLLLQGAGAAFRADPEVQAALAATRVGELPTPTLEPGETLRRSARRPQRLRGLRRRRGRRARLRLRAPEPAGARAPARRPLSRMTLVAGVDSSTQACKVVIRDAEHRRARPARAGQRIPTAPRSIPRPGGLPCRRRSARPAAWPTSPRFRSAVSSTAWCASTTAARSSARPALERHAVRVGAA